MLKYEYAVKQEKAYKESALTMPCALFDLKMPSESHVSPVDNRNLRHEPHLRVSKLKQ